MNIDRSSSDFRRAETAAPVAEGLGAAPGPGSRAGAAAIPGCRAWCGLPSGSGAAGAFDLGDLSRQDDGPPRPDQPGRPAGGRGQGHQRRHQRDAQCAGHGDAACHRHGAPAGGRHAGEAELHRRPDGEGRRSRWPRSIRVPTRRRWTRRAGSWRAITPISPTPRSTWRAIRP